LIEIETYLTTLDTIIIDYLLPFLETKSLIKRSTGMNDEATRVLGYKLSSLTEKKWFLNVYYSERNFVKMLPLDKKRGADSPNNLPTVLK